MGKGWEWRGARCLVVPIHAANLFFVRFLRISLSASLYIGPNNVRVGHDPSRVKQWNACISFPPVCRRTGFLPCTSFHRTSHRTSSIPFRLVPSTAFPPLPLGAARTRVRLAPTFHTSACRPRHAHPRALASYAHLNRPLSTTHTALLLQGRTIWDPRLVSTAFHVEHGAFAHARARPPLFLSSSRLASVLRRRR